MSIERGFDVSLIAELALREKQIQQSYRPIIGVHKWFARRPGTLFRGLLLAEFGADELKDAFFRSNELKGVRIADPFMGGGTPLIEANRIGCDVIGFDINPMAAWIVREEIEALDLDAYEREAVRLAAALEERVGRYYRTRCPIYGDEDVPVKSFLWIKTVTCEGCGASVDLFPGFVVAKAVRHPKHVLVCGACGELNEVEDIAHAGDCQACGETLVVAGPARGGRCPCPHCGQVNSYVGNGGGPPKHRLFAIEYHNAARKRRHRGRFFKKPDAADLRRVAEAKSHCQRLMPRYVPDERIPPGDETSRLLRWGYSRYRELFNARQLLGLELSCRLIAEVEDERLRRALATNLSDLLRYQNMLCRYDTMALKALDIFSVHGYPVGLVQCESNLLGIDNGSGGSVGSGGWSNIVRKYAKAKAYCEKPYEVRRVGAQRERVAMESERIGDGPRDARQVSIRCASATQIDLTPQSVDAVMTDPPYFGNVQYAELMDFCYVWLRRLVGREAEGFGQATTRSPDELTGNHTAARGIEEFTEGLAAVYQRMAVAMKPGAPLVFTYHHNKVEAYAAVGVAILDAGLTCTASLPCPAEMGGSIHIHGTESSIIDTVFVCRKVQGRGGQAVLVDRDGLLEVVGGDVAALKSSGREPTRGDLRCIMLGHMTRSAICELRHGWEKHRRTKQKLAIVAEVLLGRFGDPEQLVEAAVSPETSEGAEREEQIALPL
ncbi:MAG: DNA methylase [Gammaproteobacteria bacterium]|nr:DNA methylase [Gammaproteobacteria bacterium]MDE0224605.1 DNA methylase [Gammaproteobacteria bacterium]